MSAKLDQLHRATKRRDGYARSVAYWGAFREYAESITAKLDFAFHTEYCDNVTNNHAGSSHGRDHIILDEPVMRGNIKRVAGDSLCKPAKKFNGNLRAEIESTHVTCKRCLEIAESLIHD